MAKYLLACPCGKDVVVEDRHAGGQITCQCGAVLDVPGLRKLRHLPAAAEQETDAAPTWSPRKGLCAVVIIAACLLAALGGGFWWSMPVEIEYNPDLTDFNQNLETMSPLQAWQMWRAHYERLDETGFREFQPPGAAAIDAARRQHRTFALSAFAAAGVLLIVAAVIAMFPARTQR